MPDTTHVPRPRPLWQLFFMPCLLLIAAAAWSVFWFYSASQVDVTADAWRAREAQSGRIYDCAKRSVAGYPFRLEVLCDGARVSLVSQTAGQATQAPITAKLGKILVIAQVYDPKLLIAEFTAPATISDPNNSSSMIVNWRTARSSIIRTSGHSATGLAGVRRSCARSRQGIAADAVAARQTHRTARPDCPRLDVGSSGDRHRPAGRQVAASRKSILCWRSRLTPRCRPNSTA